MGAYRRNLVSRPIRAKHLPRWRRVQSQQERERILRERVAYMLWVMANRVEESEE